MPTARGARCHCTNAQGIRNAGYLLGKRCHRWPVASWSVCAAEDTGDQHTLRLSCHQTSRSMIVAQRNIVVTCSMGIFGPLAPARHGLVQLLGHLIVIGDRLLGTARVPHTHYECRQSTVTRFHRRLTLVMKTIVTFQLIRSCTI